MWVWATISDNPGAFGAWLAANEAPMRGADAVSRRFSNHRKYESLRASSPNGTAGIFASYIAWVAPPRTNADVIREFHRTVGQDPQAVFAALYESMDTVRRF